MGHRDEDAAGNINLWITDGTSAGTSELTAAGASSGGLSPNDFVGLPTLAGGPISDFDGDGKFDILFQNSTGEADIWDVNGTSVIGGGSIGNSGPRWHVKATGDFNGDGHADVLWQNSSGEVDIWELNGTNIIGSASLGNPGPTWHAFTTGDFNGDGRSDILWQNDDGTVAVLPLSRQVRTFNERNDPGSGSSPGNPGPAWHIKASGDFYSDSIVDLLWQNDDGQ